jgi:hypothetical protein
MAARHDVEAGLVVGVAAWTAVKSSRVRGQSRHAACIIMINDVASFWMKRLLRCREFAFSPLGWLALCGATLLLFYKYILRSFSFVSSSSSLPLVLRNP